MPCRHEWVHKPTSESEASHQGDITTYFFIMHQSQTLAFSCKWQVQGKPICSWASLTHLLMLPDWHQVLSNIDSLLMGRTTTYFNAKEFVLLFLQPSFTFKPTTISLQDLYSVSFFSPLLILCSLPQKAFFGVINHFQYTKKSDCIQIYSRCRNGQQLCKN